MAYLYLIFSLQKTLVPRCHIDGYGHATNRKPAPDQRLDYDIRDPFDVITMASVKPIIPDRCCIGVPCFKQKSPGVQTVLDSVKQFHKENYIEGKTDYACTQFSRQNG
jgi:hypothetical protein